MFRDELLGAAAGVLAEVRAHPFWAGIRSGSLPPERLLHFTGQDTRHLVPAYARALSRAASAAADAAHGELLAGAAAATFASATRMIGEFAELEQELKERLPGAVATAGSAAAGPAAVAHTAFLAEVSAAPFPVAAVGLLPMTWFHQFVSLDLTREGCAPGSPYADWVRRYVPESGFHDYVAAYLDLVEESVRKTSAQERGLLARTFLTGARHERAFVEAAWQAGPPLLE